MDNLRKYGNPPFDIALIHGGPGAPGEVAPVARELARNHGVLEPLQTKSTLQGQVHELETVLRQNGSPPMVLVGHSWGAMLGFILAARNPSLAKKLILVSSGVFEERYAGSIMTTRLGRLREEDRTTVNSLLRILDDRHCRDKNTILAQLGEHLFKADSYDPLPSESEVIEYQYDVYESVWKEARELRSSRRLLALGRRIQCPVVAIHGDFDPHPAEGVQAPLSAVVKDFRFVLMEKCGHRPWIEKAAKDRFYDILSQELR